MVYCYIPILGFALQDSQVVAELVFAEEHISENGISVRDELTVSRPTSAQSLASQSSLSASSSSPSSATASPRLSSNRSSTKKRPLTQDVIDNESVDKSLNALTTYYSKKQNVGDFAASLGQLVASTADKLPFDTQVKFLGKIYDAIKEVTNKEAENLPKSCTNDVINM